MITFGSKRKMAHLEMVGTIVHQLIDGVHPEEFKKAGLGDYYTDHGGVWKMSKKIIKI